MDPAEINKNTLRALFSAADSGDLDGVMRCFSPGYLDHDPPPVRCCRSIAGCSSRPTPSWPWTAPRRQSLTG